VTRKSCRLCVFRASVSIKLLGRAGLTESYAQTQILVRSWYL
jgi:hypothetical protein